MRFLSLLLITLIALSGCTSSSDTIPPRQSSASVPQQQGTFKVGKAYKVEGKWYQPEENYNLIETGIASWYGPNFHGKQTANGEIFDQNELTAAHRTLHMPSIVRVTNLENGRSVIVRINDRGPFKRGRIIDLSKRAAELLGYKNKGTAKVRVQVLPEESKRIAELAKNGQSTRGYENAMNDKSYKPQTQPNPVLTGSHDNLKPTDKYSPQTATVKKVESVKLDPIGDITGHTVNGNFYPDPVVKTIPVPNTGIFVQAASFSSKENALQYAQQLSPFGKANVIDAVVNGQTVHRVRFGPVNDVSAADNLLANLIKNGRDGIIVVE